MVNTVRRSVGVAMVSMLAGCLAMGVEADIDGVTPGKWTMDLDAAKAEAAKTKVPILVNFSGSDWCGWCKLMEENVFSKPEWGVFAKESLIMVLIDFPKDKSLVPEKYAERNATLKGTFGVGGYPSFFLVDSDGETVLGMLGAGREKTAESFAGEIKALACFRDAEVAKYCEKLAPADKQAYKALVKQIKSSEAGIRAEKEKIAAAEASVKELATAQADAKVAAREFRVSQLTAEKQAEYAQAKDELAEAEGALKTWLATKPNKSEETQQRYQGFVGHIKELSTTLSQY